MSARARGRLSTRRRKPRRQISSVGNVFTSTADSGNQWYLNDTAISGATGASLYRPAPGTYNTVVTDPVTGCQLKSNKTPL